MWSVVAQVYGDSKCHPFHYLSVQDDAVCQKPYRKWEVHEHLPQFFHSVLFRLFEVKVLSCPHKKWDTEIPSETFLYIGQKGGGGLHSHSLFKTPIWFLRKTNQVLFSARENKHYVISTVPASCTEHLYPVPRIFLKWMFASLLIMYNVYNWRVKTASDKASDGKVLLQASQLQRLL